MLKKEYQRPVLYAEAFEVCEHITRNCNMEAGWSTHWDSGADGGACGFCIDGPGSEQVLYYALPTCTISYDDFEVDDIPSLINYHGRNLNVSDLFSS